MKLKREKQEENTRKISEKEGGEREDKKKKIVKEDKTVKL